MARLQYRTEMNSQNCVRFDYIISKESHPDLKFTY